MRILSVGLVRASDDSCNNAAVRRGILAKHDMGAEAELPRVAADAPFAPQAPSPRECLWSRARMGLSAVRTRLEVTPSVFVCYDIVSEGTTPAQSAAKQ